MTVTGYLARTHHEPLSLLLELEQHGEIGTGLGYATLWMAPALPPAGQGYSACARVA
jgi:predicted O-methyltransferase YrrM